MFRIRLGQLYLTTNNSFARDKRRSLLLDNWSTLKWIYDHNDLYLEYNMRLELVSIFS